jgi:hypothetical protein
MEYSPLSGLFMRRNTNHTLLGNRAYMMASHHYHLHCILAIRKDERHRCDKGVPLVSDASFGNVIWYDNKRGVILLLDTPCKHNINESSHNGTCLRSSQRLAYLACGLPVKRWKRNENGTRSIG